MARNYSLKSFLRLAPKDLLERYMHGQGVGKDLQLAKLKSKDVDQVVAAIEAAGERVRRNLDRDFRDIHSLADENGTKALLEEAHERHHRLDLASRFEKMGSHLERAFWMFLEHRTIFKIASQFAHADTLRWRAWPDPIDCEPAVDEATKKTLADAISGYYRYNQARGQGCHVDQWEREQKLYWFVYPEDYAIGVPAFDEDHNFVVETQRPAFELVFVYDRATQVLDACVPGDKKTLRDLQRIFGKVVLGVDLGDVPPSAVVYVLDPLLSRDFAFETKSDDRVTEVQVRSLRLDIVGGGYKRVTLDAKSHSRDTIYDLLDEVFPGEPIPKALLQVTSARIRLAFLPKTGTRPRSRTFTVSYPDSTSLKHDPLDEKARKLLRRWGLDVSGRPAAVSGKPRTAKQGTFRV